MQDRGEQAVPTSTEGGDRDRFVTLGRVSGPYGVRGWVRVYSETEPPENILGYSPWYLQRADRWQSYQIEQGRPHGKGVVVKLAGCDDRDAAAVLSGLEIAVKRSQLADDLAPGEYYWADLEGLEVETLDGVPLGRVDHLLATGANDVLVVRGERERLIPYLPERVVVEVDLGAGRMRVDWDPDF
jgi:16S rRNA processing protein RimM